jgi:hypothetical protein
MNLNGIIGVNEGIGSKGMVSPMNDNKTNAD